VQSSEIAYQGDKRVSGGIIGHGVPDGQAVAPAVAGVPFWWVAHLRRVPAYHRVVRRQRQELSNFMLTERLSVRWVSGADNVLSTHELLPEIH
jgi:hypothetical protein